MTTGPNPRGARPEPATGASSEHDSEYVPVRHDTLDAIIQLIGRGGEHDERLRADAYQQGRQARRSGGYQAGFTLGHDTGLSARQDTRGYVHGILDGFAAGTEQRHQLAQQLLRRDQARRAPRRQPDREAGS
jgi:hypothetical protein